MGGCLHAWAGVFVRGRSFSCVGGRCRAWAVVVVVGRGRSSVVVPLSWPVVVAARCCGFVVVVVTALCRHLLVSQVRWVGDWIAHQSMINDKRRIRFVVRRLVATSPSWCWIVDRSFRLLTWCGSVSRGVPWSLLVVDACRGWWWPLVGVVTR